MTGSSQHGGKRTGAGRKSKAAEAELQRLLKHCWTKEQREAAFTIMAERAAAGGTEAIKFLSAYMFGKPAQRLIIEDDKPDTGKGKTDLSHLTAEELETIERASEILAKSRRGKGREGAA